MASLSAHLIDSFNPSPLNSSIVTHGPMSYSPMMHGTPYAQQSFSPFGSQASFANDTISEETAKKIATLQVKLNQKLGPEYISQRPGPGGGPKLTYVEGWKIINLANEVFGYHGWSSNVVSLTTDFADYNEETRRYNVGVTAIVRVTLRDGVHHEDIGYGVLENAKSKGAAFDKCKKEAVTDGLKRALRNFGNVLGNCLYDKAYAQEVIKIKVEPVKLNKDQLHRRPEFEDVKPNLSTLSASTPSSSSNHAQHNRPAYPNTNLVTPSRPPQNQAKPHTSLPSHMRSEVQSSAASGSSSSMQNPANQGQATMNLPQHHSGLNTPITTPSHHRPNAQPQPQPDRRVSFSEAQTSAPVSNTATTTVSNPKAEPDFDADDSFGFGDDDEFLALADLGPPIAADDTDAGRPIGEADMGRPIDHEEGLLPMPEEDDSGEFVLPANYVRHTKPAPPSGSGSGGMSRQELIAAALQSNTEGATTTSAPPTTTGPLSKQPLQPRPNFTGASNSTASTSSSSSSHMPPPPLQQQQQQQQQQQNQLSKSNSFAQQRHQQYMNQKQHQNQNQNQNPNPLNQNGAIGTGDAMKRSSASSIGGFNYPAGMNPLQPSNTNRSNFASSSTVGVKRPADAMSSSTSTGVPSGTSSRGGRPGMCLQQTTGGHGSLLNGSGQRQILGSLDIGESGDVKRMRR